MQPPPPPVYRGDSYGDDSYAGSYTGGGYVPGSTMRSSRCVCCDAYTVLHTADMHLSVAALQRWRCS
jgi:hypothetical protein